jgi:RNA methyltransferase, TrmH family
VPFLHGMDAELARAVLKQNRVELFAGVPVNQNGCVKSLAEVDLTGRCGLIIGSEGRGVSDGLRSAAFDVCIPTVGVESLNAAMAAGILLYEARRQRMSRA